VGAEAPNVAVTAALVAMLTVQAPVPVHAPDHPVNEEPEPAVAVRLTDVVLEKLALHVWPQLMPAGELETVPLPAPLVCTVSWKLEGATKAVWVAVPQPQRPSRIARHPTTASCLRP
jgi:hypothetical protein